MNVKSRNIGDIYSCDGWNLQHQSSRDELNLPTMQL